MRPEQKRCINIDHHLLMKDDVSQKERRLLNLLLLLGKTKASAFGLYYTGCDGNVDWALTHVLDGGGGGGRECLPSVIHTINQVEGWHWLSNCCGACGNVTVLCVARRKGSTATYITTTAGVMFANDVIDKHTAAKLARTNWKVLGLLCINASFNFHFFFFKVCGVSYSITHQRMLYMV